MNKKAFSKMLTIVMVALMGVSFVSCGPDVVVLPANSLNPVTPVTPINQFSILGTWKSAESTPAYDSSVRYEIYTFAANGTGVAYEYRVRNGIIELDDYETFTYTYDPTTNVLSMNYSNEGLETDVIRSITSTQIIFENGKVLTRV